MLSVNQDGRGQDPITVVGKLSSAVAVKAIDYLHLLDGP